MFCLYFDADFEVECLRQVECLVGGGAVTLGAGRQLEDAWYNHRHLTAAVEAVSNETATHLLGIFLQKFVSEKIFNWD